MSGKKAVNIIGAGGKVFLHIKRHADNDGAQHRHRGVEPVKLMPGNLPHFTPLLLA